VLSLLLGEKEREGLSKEGEMAGVPPLPITAFTALTDIAEDEQCQELEQYLTGKGAEFSGEPDGELSERLLPIIRNCHLVFHGTELSHQEIEGFFYTVVSLFHVVSADDAHRYMIEFLDQLTTRASKENGSFILRLLGLTFDQFEPTNQLCPLILTRRLEVACRTGLQSSLSLDLNKLEKWVSGWKMSELEKKALYSDLWNTYQHSASKSVRSGLLIQLLKCYSASESGQVVELSRQLVALSIADPHLFLMDHLLEIPPVAALRGERIYQLLIIFVQEKLSSFVEFYNSNKDFVDALGLDYQQAVHKMRLLTLASLASETSQVSFPDLTVQLDLPQDRVEALIIEAIQLKLIRARINQMTESLVVMSSVHRTFSQPQWLLLCDRLSSLQQRIHSVRASLSNIKT
jgi:translation initiation factor 3 subunit M